MDWNKTKIHCSSIYGIMAGDTKTNMQIYMDACNEIVEKQARYDKMKKKDGTNGFKLIEDISKMEAIIPILESQKDVEIPLSNGCKTHLAGVYATEKYNKWNPSKDIGSRATEKGKEVEPEALALVSVLNGVFLIKNEERIENEWFSGLPDAIEINESGEVIIHDVKCPENIESYFSVVGKKIIPQYYWQMQGYMDLTGAKIAQVHYCLVNSPEHQIKDAAAALLRRMNVISEYSPEYIKAEKELVNNLTYDDIPIQERRWSITVERNDADIERARRKVEKCREYLEEFEKVHLNLYQDSEKLLTLMQ
jgi:hypothetical protein